jgi:peptide/nickel transport system substrate-binding protein
MKRLGWLTSGSGRNRMLTKTRMLNWRRNWRSLISVALSAVMAIALSTSLSSCNIQQFRTQSTDVPQIVLGLSEPRTFNYILSQEVPNIFNRIYTGLLSEDGVTGELSPGLAESWEVSKDNLSVTFKLRPDLKWSDGQPLTADDVVFTFEQLVFNPKIPTSKKDMLRIGGEKGVFPTVKKLSDRQVQFTTPEPFAPLLRSLAGGVDSGIAIMPKHRLAESIQKMDADGNPLFLSTWGTDTNPKDIVGTGPYVLASYKPNERIIFRRNPYYWRKGLQGNPLPQIERFVWQIVDSPETVLMQFRSGDLDLMGVGPTSFQLLKGEEERGNFKIFNMGPASGTSFMSFNLNQGKRKGKPVHDPTKIKWFNMVQFRQAVAYGIDRQTLINNLYRGLAAPQESPMSVQNPYYLSPKSGRLPDYSYNPDKSKQLLKEAGFKYLPNGQLTDADGKPVRFTLMFGAGGRDELPAQIKSDLAKIGMQVDLQPIEFKVILEKLDNTFDWDAVLMGFSDSDFDPNGGANVWSLSGRLHLFNQVPPPGEEPLEGMVFASWEQDIARLFDEAARTVDDKKRKELYAQTQILAQENLPFIHLVNPLTMVAVRNTIKGIRPSAMKGTLWNIHEVKVEEK